MSTSPNLTLPYIQPAQAQKHVTHNEALRVLDALVQLAALDRDLASPPGSPANGDRYIVATGASGAWSGHDLEIAAFQDGAWTFYPPLEGWIAWVADENAALAYDGSAWITLSAGGGGGGGPSLNPATGGLVGINATADTTNRLSLASAASLFNHDGAGHQQKINKAAPGDTASQLYQSGFSGRAEIGLTGDDDFHFKVSPDGTAWHEALVIDRTSGGVAHKAGARTTFQHGASLPGLRILPAAGDPSALLDGDLWYNSTTGKFRKREAGVTSDLAAAGGGGGGTGGTIVLASDYANNTTTLQAVTGMSFAVAANKTYLVQAFGRCAMAAATTGIAIALDGPAGTTVTGMCQNPLTSSSFTGTYQATVNTTAGASTGAPGTNIQIPIFGWWVVITAASTGDVTFKMRSEVAGSNATLYAGATVLQWQELS